MAESVLEQKKINMTRIKIASFHRRQFVFNLIEKRFEYSAQALGQVFGRAF